MKIALLTDGIYPYVIGGMQKHSYCLAKYLARQEVFVDLYHTPMYGNRTNEMEAIDCFTAEEKKFIRPFLIEFPRSSKLPGHYIRESYLYSSRVYERFLKNGEVDFIYAKGFTPWRFIEEKEKGKKLPPIGVKFHGYEMFQKATSFPAKVHRKLFFRKPVKDICRRADFVFSYGGKITDLVLSLDVERKRIIEIPSGVESDWLASSINPAGRIKKFVFVGRYERRKGIQELTEAVCRLHEMGKKENHFEFHFIGPIPESKRIGLNEVHYHGVVASPGRMKQMISEADILVCPSYSEGMPNVIIEAMSRGLAIIATDVGAVNCLVSSENGFLLGECSVSNIEQAMLSALALPQEELSRMKKSSLEKVKQSFLWEDISARLVSRLQEITGKKR